MTRPTCPSCQQRPRAVAYHKYQRIYYRSQCSVCLAKIKKTRPPRPRWQLSGYKKKMQCDVCGFRARWAAQTVVCHVDGDLGHTEPKNLRTVCRNCEISLAKTDSVWRLGDLEPDA